MLNNSDVWYNKIFCSAIDAQRVIMNKIIDNKKRHLLKNLLFLSPAAYLAACDSTNEQSKISSDKFPKIKLKMVTSFPKNLPDTDLPAQRLAKKLNKCH